MPNALGAIQTNLENSVISSRLRPECDRELVDLLDDEFVVINDYTLT